MIPFLQGLLATKPLRVRVVVLVAVVLLVTVLGQSASFTFSLTGQTESLLKERALNLATVMATLVSAAVDFDQPEAATDRLNALSQTPDAIYAAIYAPDGAIVAQWGKVPPSAVVPLPVLTSTTKDDNAFLHVAVPVGHAVHDTLIIAFSRAEQHRQQQTVVKAALATSGLLLPLMILLGYLFAAGLVRPIRAMTEIAQAITRGDRVAVSQLPTDRPDEAGTLARAFQRLLIQEHENQALLEARVEARTRELQDANEELALRLRQLREAQEQLVQTGKMAAVGQLAGGVAHEINNPLAVILGFAQGLDRRIPEGDPLRLPVSSIVREALRCKNLVQELLTFSRTGRKSVEPLELNALVRATVVLIEARARTQSVKMVQELEEKLPVLEGNKTQLQQILVNLGTNALDVMKGGGTLTVRTQTQGGHIYLEVSDTGGGIPEEVRARMFEPFFTTKPVGEGTGLGLSLVYEIVQQHRGGIEVDTQLGKGTTIRIRLPVNAKEGAAA